MYDSVAAYTPPAKKRPNLKIKLVQQGVCPMRLGLFGFNCVTLLLILGLSSPVCWPGMWPQAHSTARAGRALWGGSPDQPPAKAGQLWGGTGCSGLGPLGAAAQLHEEMTAGSPM